MFQQKHNQHRQSRPLARGIALATTAIITTVALGTGAGVGPAAARQDGGPAAARVGHTGECFLTRLGTQYERCDNNTGDGVPAPAWVPRR